MKNIKFSHFVPQSWGWIPEFREQQGLCTAFQAWTLPVVLNVFHDNIFWWCRIFFFVLDEIFRIKNVLT